MRIIAKICPFRAAAPYAVNTDCRGARCAWWYESAGQCIVSAAAIVLINSKGRDGALEPLRMKKYDEYDF